MIFYEKKNHGSKKMNDFFPWKSMKLELSFMKQFRNQQITTVDILVSMNVLNTMYNCKNHSSLFDFTFILRFQSLQLIQFKK